MANSTLGTGFTLLWRDWKSGQLTILIVSLLLATATVTSIGLFTDRIKNSIEEEATQFLAADAQVRGPMEIPRVWRSMAQHLNLKTAQTVGYRAMAFSDSGMYMGSVKAVSNNYPLKGSLSISDEAYGEARKVFDGPQPGEAWLTSRLFGALDIEVGDTISVGKATLKVTAALIKEPDSAQSFFGVAPRIMINLQDLTNTAAVQKGSRVNYIWMLMGEKQAIESLSLSLEDKLGNHYRWVGIKEGNRGVAGALDRAEQFLLLAGSLSVVLSGIAIALSARRYSRKQMAQVALLKTFGKTPNDILLLYSGNLILLGIVSLVLGSFLGWSLHLGILTALSSLIPQTLAPASLSAYWTGSISGFVALLAFAAPPLFALKDVPPARVIRSDTDGGSVKNIYAALIGIIAICGLVFWFSGSVKLTLIVTLGGGFCLIGVSLFALVLIRVAKIAGQKWGKSWRIGLASLRRHQEFNALQIIIFSVLFMLLFVLFETRSSLISQWQDQLPENAPNHFIYNIFSNERADVDALFTENGIETMPFYPMARGRIMTVNGTSIIELKEKYKGEMNYERELNLTWSKELGEDNAVVSGDWWGESSDSHNETILASVEQEYAEGLGVQIGDELLVSVAGEEFNAVVASIRSVKWDSMNPNFFVIFNKNVIGLEGVNWLTSFYLSTDQKPFLNKLGREFPTVTFVELDQMIEQIQGIVSKVSMAIEFILLLVLLAGFVVLVTSVQATLDVRMKESAILRTLGAKRGLVNRSLLIEFSTLGALAGLLAAFSAEACLYFLQEKVFELDYQARWQMWLIGPFLGAILVGLIGWLSTRKVTYVPPLAVLSRL